MRRLLLAAIFAPRFLAASPTMPRTQAAGSQFN